MGGSLSPTPRRPRSPLLLALLVTAAVVPQIGLWLVAQSEPIVIDMRADPGGAVPAVSAVLGTVLIACAVGAATLAVLRLPWSFREGTAVLAAAPWALLFADLGAGAIVHHQSQPLRPTLTQYFAAAGGALFVLHGLAALRGAWPRGWLDAAWGVEKTLLGGLLGMAQIAFWLNPGGTLAAVLVWAVLLALAPLAALEYRVRRLGRASPESSAVPAPPAGTARLSA
jgi:hypothetical protein